MQDLINLFHGLDFLLVHVVMTMLIISIGQIKLNPSENFQKGVKNSSKTLLSDNSVVCVY